MDTRAELRLTELTTQSFAAYGTVLGKPLPREGSAVTFSSRPSDFWREHVFATGGHDPEILWVAYRDADPRIDRLESHLLTEQAVIPLTGPIIQVVATSTSAGGPDMATIRAFRVPVGQGLSMRPGCWHATRVPAGEATCLMLTRASTTADLIGHLAGGSALTESAFAEVRLALAPIAPVA